MSWGVEGADALRLAPGDVDVSGLSGFTVRPGVTTTYTLYAANGVGEVAASVEVRVAAEPPPARLVRPLLVAGQSNAQGRNVAAALAASYVTADAGVAMLGNDDVWKVAYEPLDDCTDQVDSVSVDPGGGTEPCVAMGNSGVSMGVAFGNALTAAVGDEVLLIPAARGGSDLVGNLVPPRDWEPTPVRDDPSTLFGSAVRRWRLADDRGASPEHGALFWYQGESEATSDRYPLFQARTDVVFDAFTDEIGAPIIFVQLSRYVPLATEDPQLRNLLYQQVRERQRTMETDATTLAGTAASTAEPDRYMVVTHDLPMFDRNHLSVAAQLELGRRVALAFREHVLGEAVDGTGPRLDGIDRAAGDANVYVRFDRPVTAPQTPTAAAYAGYFRVFEGATELAIASIDRDAVDPATVRILLAAPPSSVVSVRYMPPTELGDGIEVDVIRAATYAEPIPGTQACLPAPAFGDATGSVSMLGFELPEVYEE
ncbi:MAG: sialate O-acetylesterase [Trueperaceae bacterium]|nr:sialate O-acetylesterase [Trueperaceae bacterium]